MRRLNHVNCVSLIRVFDEQNEMHLVMELVSGKQFQIGTQL